MKTILANLAILLTVIIIGAGVAYAIMAAATGKPAHAVIIFGALTFGGLLILILQSHANKGHY